MTLSAASILSRSTGSGSSSARDLWCCWLAAAVQLALSARSPTLLPSLKIDPA